MEHFVKHLPAAVAMFDRAMRYLMASDQWIADYSLSDRQVIGKTHYDLFPDIEKRQDWKEFLRRAHSGERTGFAGVFIRGTTKTERSAE